MKLFLSVIVTSLVLSNTNAEIFIVNNSVLSFFPDELTVAPGDTVRWEYALGTGQHTVTSGTDCQPDGLWFDEPLSIMNPVVEWLVPVKAIGDVPYYCAPHCGFGMTAIIHVVNDCPEDIDGSGAVDVADILAVISAWGQTDVPEDIDGSGTVDVGDLLMIIGSWGPC
jgi:plastocyanin